MNANEEAVDDPAPSTSTTQNAEEIFEQKIIALAQAKPKGISDVDISQGIPNLKAVQKAKIINKLLSESRIVLFTLGKPPQQTLLYKLQDSSTAQAVKGADQEDQVVYNIIQQAGTKAIWVRSIRYLSKLSMTQVNKSVKSLVAKRVIKLIKSVAAGKKKYYMLYNLEPDTTITGGSWYQDQDFESEFVDVLNQQCYRFLEMKVEAAKNIKGGPIAARDASYVTSQDVWQFISDLKISKVRLSVEDIEMILNTLIYDGKVEKTPSDDEPLYRAIQPLVDRPGLMLTPCGLCPVMKNCYDLGDVTPSKCVYFTQWLDESTA